MIHHAVRSFMLTTLISESYPHNGLTVMFAGLITLR